MNDKQTDLPGIILNYDFTKLHVKTSNANVNIGLIVFKSDVQKYAYHPLTYIIIRNYKPPFIPSLENAHYIIFIALTLI